MSGYPTLTEKVIALIQQVEHDHPEVDDLTERVIYRIETTGRREYALDDGAERHEQASVAEEARNFCEEIEDALAYAANAYYLGGDPRWRAVAPALAVLWEMAREVESRSRGAQVLRFPDPASDHGGAA